MREHGGLCRKVFDFSMFDIAHPLILYAMSDSVGRNEVFICGSGFSAPLSCAVGKTVQKVVQRVLPRTPKERAAKAGGALYCCCRECFLKGFCASVCFQGYCVSAQGKRRHMPQHFMAGVRVAPRTVQARPCGRKGGCKTGVCLPCQHTAACVGTEGSGTQFCKRFYKL